MNNILFLDDCPDRIAKFRTLVPTAKTAETANDMINLISKQSGKIDKIFLDHDLGGEIDVDSSRADCGMEVVRWLSRHRVDVDQIIVHSLNEDAADEMQNKLDRAGYNATYIPFYFLTHNPRLINSSEEYDPSAYLVR